MDLLWANNYAHSFKRLSGRVLSVETKCYEAGPIYGIWTKHDQMKMKKTSDVAC